MDHANPQRLMELEVAIHHKTKQEEKVIWKEKSLHGRHPNEVNQDYLVSIRPNYGLTLRKMFSETEGLLLTIKDQVIPTKNYLKYIVKVLWVQSIQMSGAGNHSTSEWILPDIWWGRKQREARFGRKDTSTRADKAPKTYKRRSTPLLQVYYLDWSRKQQL